LDCAEGDNAEWDCAATNSGDGGGDWTASRNDGGGDASAYAYADCSPREWWNGGDGDGVCRNISAAKPTCGDDGGDGAD